MTSPTYVRVTITTERRNVEMLLPAYRQVAELMPEILQICGTSSTHHTPQALTLTPVGSATLRARKVSMTLELVTVRCSHWIDVTRQCPARSSTTLPRKPRAWKYPLPRCSASTWTDWSLRQCLSYSGSLGLS